MNVLFIDIEEVLVNDDGSTNRHGIDLLNKIEDQTNCKVVLTRRWDTLTAEQTIIQLNIDGLRFEPYDILEPFPNTSKEYIIKRWIENRSEDINFKIVGNDYMYKEYYKHFIPTNTMTVTLADSIVRSFTNSERGLVL